MDINLEFVVSMMVLLSIGLGLSLALKFLNWMLGIPALNDMKWFIHKPIIRLTMWLILGSLLAKPLLDLSSLLIELAKTAYMFTLPLSDRGLPSGWEIQHYALFLGIRVILFGMVYGYAIWAMSRITSVLSFEKGISINPHSFEGVCITLVCGSLLNNLITTAAFSIQQLPLATILGNENTATGYFISWLVALILFPAILYGLHKIVKKHVKSTTILGTNPP
jgi:hypothetical protein